jgi:hypothetical protein
VRRNDQLRASLNWLGESFIISSTGLAVAIYVLARWTGWGRQVWRISGGHAEPGCANPCPGATLVSVGHRSSLLSFSRVLELLGEGKWRLEELPAPAGVIGSACTA